MAFLPPSRLPSYRQNKFIAHETLQGADLGIPLNIIANLFTNLHYNYDITKPYNLEGSFYELDCTIPFGFFNKYLILRLQYANEIWYFKKISSLSYKRIKMLVNIAETFKGN